MIEASVGSDALPWSVVSAAKENAQKEIDAFLREKNPRTKARAVGAIMKATGLTERRAKRFLNTCKLSKEKDEAASSSS